MKENINSSKPSHYYSFPRDEIVGMVPCGCGRILDIGCGAGVVGKRLKEERGAGFVAGIEIDHCAAEEAKKNLDIVIEGDIESMELPFNEEDFDCMIFGDIIEHLKDPWATLAAQKRLLKKDGYAVLSIPNARYYPVSLNLLAGRWKYDDLGVLDRTHLRFFTKSSMIELIEGSGYAIQEIRKGFMAPKAVRVAGKLALGIFDDFLVRQYFFLAKKQRG